MMQRSMTMNLATFLVSLQAILLLPTLMGGLTSTSVGLLSRLACAVLAANIAVAAVGFWQMKKHGFYVYLIYAALSQIYFFIHGSGVGAPLVFSVLIIILGAVNLEEMNNGEKMDEKSKVFRCDKCGIEMKNEMGLNMHKRSCGANTAAPATRASTVRQNVSPGTKPSSAVSSVGGASLSSSSVPVGSRPQPRRPVMPQKTVPTFSAPGPNKRICAYLIDMALLQLATKIFNLGPLINFAFQIFYILFRDTIDGRGLGKRFVGLVVEDENGNPAFPQACAIRNLTLALPIVLMLIASLAKIEAPGMLLLLGVLLLEYTMTRNREDGRRVGDMLAGTRVCDRSAEIGDGRFFWYSLLAVIVGATLSAGNQAGINSTNRTNSEISTVQSKKEIEWQKFKASDGTYSIMLPGSAKEVDKDFSEGNLKVLTRLVNLKAAGMDFVVIAMTFPNSIENIPLDNLFAGGKANLIADPADKLEDEKKIYCGIHEGREYKVALGKPKGAKIWGRVIINVKKRKMVMAMVQYGREDFVPESVSRFLDSIEIH